MQGSNPSALLPPSYSLLIHLELSSSITIQPIHISSIPKPILLLFNFYGGANIFPLRPRRDYLLAVHGSLTGGGYEQTGINSSEEN